MVEQCRAWDRDAAPSEIATNGIDEEEKIADGRLIAGTKGMRRRAGYSDRRWGIILIDRTLIFLKHYGFF